MDGPRDCHTEVRQTEKQKHCMTWNLKSHDINELLKKQKQTQRTNLWLPAGLGEQYGEGIVREFEIDR